MGIPEMVGGSIGTLPNPWILVAGFIVAKRHPLTAEFWLRLVCAMIVCVLLSFLFDAYIDLPGSDLELGKLIPWTSLAVLWASLFFLAVRRPSKGETAEFETEED